MITELTAEQQGRLEEYVQRGIRMGLSTDPIDPKVARRFTVWLYTDILKKSVPPTVIVRGPRDLHHLAHLITDEQSPVPREEVSRNDKVGTSKTEAAFVWPYLDGQFWASWFAYYDYMKEVLGVKLPDTYEKLYDLVNLGLIYPLERVCIISERMEQCHRNLQNRLHKDGGPAVSYRDGFKVWCLNGVRVDQRLAETPRENLDPMEFAKISNVEVRREFLRKVGPESIVQAGHGKVVDKTPDGVYELIVLDLKGNTGEWPYLKMLNPSIGVWHMEAVGKECRTVEAAIKFRNKTDLKPIQLT